MFHSYTVWKVVFCLDNESPGYLYSKYSAAYRLLKKGIFEVVTICDSNLTHDTDIYTASSK